MNGCIHHPEEADKGCAFCVIYQQTQEIAALNAKITKFYNWFRMPTGKVDDLLRKMP
jgi:hypothetical protein